MISNRHRGAVTVLALGTAMLAGLVHPADDTTSSLDEARAMLERGDHEAAEREARTRLPEMEASFGRDSVEVAEALDLVVEAALQRKAVRATDLVEYAARAVGIKEAHLGRHSSGFVESSLRQARLLSALSEYASAEEKYREAVSLLESIHGPDHEQVADGVHHFARMLIKARDDIEAKKLLERVITIREVIFGPGDVSLVNPLTQLGWVLMDDGKQEEAQVVFERAVGIAEGYGEESVPALANALAGYGNLLKRTGDFAGAREIFERAVVVTEAHADRQAWWLAASLDNLGQLMNATGEYEEAGFLLDRALETWESLVGPADPYVGSTLVQIGWMRMEQGDYVGARTAFERAVAIADRSGERDRLANALAGYGSLLRRTGDHQEARAVFERAVRVAETPPIMKLWLGGSLLNLGGLLGDAGELVEAEGLCRRGLKLWEELSFRGLVQTGRTMLADILSKAGRNDEARRLYEQVLNEREEDHGPDSDEAARALVPLARTLHESGELSRARELYERAVRTREKTLGPDAPAVGWSLAGLADSLFDLGELGEALAKALRAEETGRESLRLTARALSERQALAYASMRPDGLDLALTILAREPTRSGDATARVWDALIRSRALVLDEMSARHRSIGGTDEIVRVAQDLSAWRTKLANLTLRGPGDLPTGHYRKILEDTRANKERAERALAEKSAAFRRESELRRIGLVDVTEALPPDTALVAYVRYRHRQRHAERTTEEPQRRVDVDTRPWRTTSRYLALVLPSRDVSPVAVPLGLARSIDTRITAWAEEARVRPASVGSAARGALEKYRSTGEALRRAIWDPVVPQVGGAANVLVVPDGLLHLVNLMALPTTTDRYLVETGPRVHLVSTERDVVKDTEAETRGDSLLVLGNPDFEARLGPPPPEVLELARLRPESVADLEGAEIYRGQQPSCKEMSAMRFGPLPASRIEVDSIASLWTEALGEDEATPSSPTLKLTGPAAHETLFKSIAPHHAVLHLATHGFFVEGDCDPAFATAEAVDVAKAIGAPSPNRDGAVMVENPLLRAGLALAGANNRTAVGATGDDGILTAEEVASLDLSGIDWAVLSACRTGVGEITTGEGVLGLRRAFEVAGANTLIMTLWAVDDEATRAWMRELYLARLAGSSTAESVARASCPVIEERREAGLSVHPFYWGAFVAAGDWR
jgi:CHAT domain-containing protein/tetratricopeptide (TPR) repeat protein